MANQSTPGRVFRRRDGQRVAGFRRTAFIHNWDYHLAEIRVYADGVIDCWGLVDFEGFQRKVREGWVVTTLPEGAKVHVSPLGSFRATEVWNDVPEADFVREVADLIDELQGRSTSAERCLAAWEVFRNEPSEGNRTALRAAYELIPVYLRDGIFSDQDGKDFPIRAAIYGPDGIPPEQVR